MKTPLLLSIGLLSVACAKHALQVSAGNNHTCAVLDDGGLLCWGVGDFSTENFGQLGYANDEGIGDDESPTSAGKVEVGGPVTQVATGATHTCALLDTGSVRCWGEGNQGRLGYGNENNIGDDETPEEAGDVNIGGNVVQIAAGFEHTCALLETGTVRCWGRGSLGELGYGNGNDIGDDETPASVGDVNVGGTVVQLATGSSHTCAVLDTGGVRCWGFGLEGQLGYGNTDSVGNANTPADVGDVPVGGFVVQVAAGSGHTCALLDTGNVRCWGQGGFGRLGYGNEESIGVFNTPDSAGDVPIGGKVTQLTSTAFHTCALLETGNVRCWGLAGSGVLGYANRDNVGNDETPQETGDVNVGGAVIQLSTGDDHTCAVLENRAVRCWGNGASGRLGYANTDDIGDDETPDQAGDVLGF